MANYETLIKRCKSLSQIKQLQSHLIASGHFFSPSPLSPRAKLIDHCATHLSLQYAQHIFHNTPSPNLTTNDFNAIIRGLTLSPHPQDALKVFVELLRRGKVDALSCSFVVKACGRVLKVREVMGVHGVVLGFGFDADLRLKTTFLDVYAKVGLLGFAGKVFDEMGRRDLVVWNALVVGLAQGGEAGKAVRVFQRMRGEGLRGNEVTFIGVLSACGQLGDVKEGERVVGVVKDEGLDGDVVVCNAVIDMYSKCGFVDKAYGVFEGMRCERNLITWNTMIMAFAMHGDGGKALELFEEMGRVGVVPDEISYLAVLCACNHAGLVDDGIRFFESMVGSCVVPNMKHYGSVVDLLGRAGRVQQAYDIIISMPMQPDIVLWQSLLGACKTYGNVEMAELASKKLEEMGSNSCGDFVLLSNVYAARGRWDDVGRVREAMKSRDVKKIPGFSYTEVDGIMHKFINGDQSHPNWREIYQKLDEIRFRIKSYGYVEETNLVLHDIGQEDKENVLSYHSEKLAVAYGLISTREGTPIRVIKNLRICSDCHEVIKFVSKIYNKEIIVRDRARFHRFKDGSCSCKDYW